MKSAAKHPGPFLGLFVRPITVLLALGLIGFTAFALRKASQNPGYDSRAAVQERLPQPAGGVPVAAVETPPGHGPSESHLISGQSESDRSYSEPLAAGARSADLDKLPPGEQASLWAALSEARRAVQKLTDHEAAMEPNHGVHYFAANPSEQLNARFLASEARIQSSRDGSDWQATLRLSRVAGQALASSTTPQATGTRVEYHYPDGVTEWYVNRQEGIEHGFTLDRRPADAPVGELRVEMEIDGLEVATAEGDSNDLTFSTPDADMPVLRYSKLLVTDASGKNLPATMEPTDGGLAIVVNDTSARYPVTIDPIITSQEQKLGPAIEPGGSGAAGDYFGFSVALSGDTALIGSYRDDNATSTDAGSAYVFIRSGSTWSLQAKLTDAGFLSYNRFGFSVALDGDTALIGASGFPSEYISTGRAYVFVRSGTTWSQQANLFASDGSSGDQFGLSVALTGDTAIVGSPYDTTTVGTNVGSAYIFVRSGSTWSQQAKLTAADALFADRFGIAVAVAGDTAIVGADSGSSASVVDTGSAYIFVRSGTTWSQQAKLNASDAATGDNFGWSVSLSGETSLIGAFGDNDSRGSAYVFVRSGTTWSQQAKLIASDGTSVDNFGFSVALTGNSAIVGAPYDDSAAGTDSGSAYIFIRSGASWSQQAKLTASDAAAYDYFGRSVALSSDTALVGAYLSDTNAGDAAGSAYVFIRSGTTWSQQTKLNAADAAAYDWFGYSVALSGDTALIGAYRDDTAAAPESGSVYVFLRSGITWSQQAKLTASDAAYSDRFGISVAVDGDSALVGAELDTTSPGLYTGSAYVFVRSGTMWSQQAKLTAADGASNDYFGCSVSLSGDTALVGSYYDSTVAGTAAGSACVFVRSGTTWSQQTKLTASDGASYDNFGFSVSLSGDTALVGAYAADTASGSNAGSAYVFVRSGTIWSEQVKLTAVDGAADDYFGKSVALSGDTALVGAIYDDTAAGADAGSAYVFVRSGTIWSEQSKLTAADGAANDYFGSSVALSGDTALVGSYYDDTPSGTNAGSSYVYLRTGTVWSQEAKLTAVDGAYNDYFGNSVALSGDTALIGAYADDGYDSIGHSVADQGGVYIFRIGDSSAPEIAIEQSGSDIASGATKSFGLLVVGSSSELVFTILNTGNADLTLSGSPKADVTGSPDFTVTAQPTSPVTGPSGSSDFTVRFTPTGSGLKTASLSIPNDDDDEDPFVIELAGTALSFSTDSDNDGLSDASEFNMAALGFDWQVNQSALVSTLFDNAAGAGLFTAGQVQAMNTGTPLISRNPTTGKFKLTMDWKKSTNLTDFVDFPAPPGSTATISPQGDVEFEFPSTDNAAFFRIEMD